MYWDPLPTVADSSWLPMLFSKNGERELGPPDAYLLGKWEDRNWQNLPGPFYGAETDSCWMGRDVAPNNVVYEDEYGCEVVFRQPRNPDEVHRVLTAAWADPWVRYAADGDEHWTLELIREWWGERARLAEWIDTVHRTWSVSERSDEREAAQGLADYGAYLANGAEDYLRGYAFWLEQGRVAEPGETLPRL